MSFYVLVLYSYSNVLWLQCLTINEHLDMILYAICFVNIVTFCTKYTRWIRIAHFYICTHVAIRLSRGVITINVFTWFTKYVRTVSTSSLSVSMAFARYFFVQKTVFLFLNVNIWCRICRSMVFLISVVGFELSRTYFNVDRKPYKSRYVVESSR